MVYSSVCELVETIVSFFKFSSVYRKTLCVPIGGGNYVSSENAKSTLQSGNCMFGGGEVGRGDITPESPPVKLMSLQITHRS